VPVEAAVFEGQGGSGDARGHRIDRPVADAPVGIGRALTDEGAAPIDDPGGGRGVAQRRTRQEPAEQRQAEEGGGGGEAAAGHGVL